MSKFKFLTIALACIIGLQSCEKETNTRTDLSRQVVSFRHQNLEVSKRSGSSPTIVLVSGFSSEMGTWEKVYRQLRPNTAVFTYNRPGVGRSADVAGKRDAATIAAEMKAVLDANGVKPPYVLVGHSMGGIYARMFYHQNPALVKGLVLVDATHERQLDSLLSLLDAETKEQMLAGMTAEFNNDLAAMPAGSIKEEFRSNFRENYVQMGQHPAITNIPVYVLTSTKLTPGTNPVIVEVTRALHQQWATSAGSKGRFVTTEKSGHYIQVEEPALVVDAINWVLQ